MMKNSYRKWFMATFMVAVAFICPRLIYAQQCPNVVWADEFNGSTLDGTKWSYQTGDGCAEGICGWGNSELQYYQESNVTVTNGQLHITAKKQRVQSKAYTSGRIRSINKGDWTYGRFEARIKLPAGKGLWPAFWMLSTDEAYGGWPKSGEIDIMEYVSAEANKVLGTIHYGDPYPNNQHTGANYYLNSGSFSDAFHDFAVEWEPGVIRWFVDDILFLTKTSQDIAPYNWPFDKRFHFLLNVAVGGNLGGTVDDSIFPKAMDVDYVRVYSGFKPYATGKRVVLNKETGVAYSVGNLDAGTSVTWAVPAGATITSGQGTKNITVNFGDASGNVSATFSTTCGSQQINVPVEVEPPFVREFSFENFDQPATATLGTYTGTYSKVANPSASGVNTSAQVGKYIRSSTQQYDLITYNVTNITDASLYTSKSKKFYLDVYTSAPVGTEITLQLETSTATSSNYPTGRHSRYTGKTTVQNQWQRIPFTLLDRPDGAASNTGVTKMILLFASNTYTGDTYYYDNLDSYQAGTANAVPTVSITSPANGASFASGASVAVAANAADTDGTISKVEFFANGNLIGTATSSPYSINWVIGTGTYALTAKATDNAGATTTSGTVSVTGQGGSATSLAVSSIVTGTVSASGGNKYGLATVTIKDNLGNPVANATVTGTFSGSYTGTRSGITGANGTVDIVTTSTAKGTVTVNFCVNSVTHGTLPYDQSKNTVTCTGAGATSMNTSTTQKMSAPEMASIQAYPNPSKGAFTLSVNLPAKSDVQVTLYDIRGRMVEQVPTATLSAGTHSLSFDKKVKAAGLYLIKVRVNDQEYQLRQVNQK
ncbi:family 16 glycosylhydrolase [Pontibacter sp. CAU 1760]